MTTQTTTKSPVDQGSSDLDQLRRDAETMTADEASAALVEITAEISRMRRAAALDGHGRGHAIARQLERLQIIDQRLMTLEADLEAQATVPAGFVETDEGTIVCSHRAVSCCPSCVATDARLVRLVGGAVMLVPDEDDRARLEAIMRDNREARGSITGA